ncbi:MAG: universal stress protein [Gammaproteobacteria bacterium]|nr:universal stress protein [Gammaproteobacteria bacterium]
MTRRQRILVVVDPKAATQPALARAARVAPSLGLDLKLLVCLHEPLPARRLGPEAAQRVRTALLDRQLDDLRDLARGYPTLAIDAQVVWDQPLHEAIIRETLRCEPRLVMKDTHFHTPLQRALFTSTDWHLIRDCPVPLWLVRDHEWPAQPVISAFVDPVHEHDKPAELDHRLLDEAAWLAQRLGGRVRAVHCCQSLVPAAGLPVTGWQASALAEAVEREHGVRFAELTAAHGLDAADTDMPAGDAADVIPEVARSTGTDLAVLGAVARSRMQQAFIGSTAEQVLERLPCDVLVIKPARFESAVTWRAQAPDFMEVH